VGIHCEKHARLQARYGTPFGKSITQLCLGRRASGFTLRWLKWRVKCEDPDVLGLINKLQIWLDDAKRGRRVVGWLILQHYLKRRICRTSRSPWYKVDHALLWASSLVAVFHARIRDELPGGHEALCALFGLITAYQAKVTCRAPGELKPNKNRRKLGRAIYDALGRDLLIITTKLETFIKEEPEPYCVDLRTTRFTGQH
jgi:hypothetical protein